MKYISALKNIDWLLLVAVLLLVAFGLAAIYSVALGQGTGEFLNFKKQAAWLVVGLLLLFFFANFDYRHWRKLGWLGYAVSLALLILVLTPLGATVRGTRGWFSFGPINFQPVELAKIFLIIVLADVASRYARTIHKFGQLVMIGLITLAPLALVLLQPDLGSAMILFFTWLVLMFMIMKNKWHLAIIIGLILVVFLASWFFVLEGYQQDRILTFLNPAADPLGRGYNVQQSIIAVGAGRFFGRGLGFGSQSQLKFIPESQTDFIFAVLAEELGFVGVVFVLGFFFFVFYRLYQIAARAPDDFAMFLPLITLIALFIQVFINIGMGVGLLPVTGISLPFVSYGGSFLVAVLVLIGLAMNVHRSSLITKR